MNEKTLTVLGLSDFAIAKLECFSLVSLTENQLYRNVDIMQLSFLQVGFVFAVQKKYLRPLDRNVFRVALEDMP